MRKMSDTIARLVAMRRQGAHTPSLASSDRLSTLDDFGSNPGGLQARFYLPESLGKGAPLVVVLHGCTQNATGYDYNSGWSQLADEAGFALLYPEQQRSNNPNLCFNWFLPADTTRDRGEVLSIRQMIDKMVVTYGIDPERIFVTGLSAGGAMAVAMLAAYPETFAGGGIIAGLPYASATTIPEAFDRMRGHGGPSEQELRRRVQRASSHEGPWPKVSIWQGSADHTVAPSNAEDIAGQWKGLHKLDGPPAHSESEGRWTKKVWCDNAGAAKIEVNMIAGMGHGTPLGDDGLGAPGSHMLNVGISSTREIARFWDIAEDAGKSVSARSRPAATGGERPARRHSSGISDTQTGTTKTRKRSPTASAVGSLAADPHGVKTIIEDALRTAGLMR